MSVWIRRAGQWEDVTPRGRSAGAWTDETDSWYGRAGGQWEVLYPETPIGGGVLLPVENLAVTFVDWHSMESTWTNPVQPSVDATAAQIRIVETTTVWDEYDGPPTGYAHGALLPETEYQLQVRLVRRVLGEITHLSEPRSVFFVTAAELIGEPAPDPPGGGGGGGTTFRLPPTSNPGVVGGSACWWYVFLQVWDMDAWGWVDTSPLISDEVDGNGSDWEPDLSLLDPGTYRVVRQQICNGIPGAVVHGDPFAVVNDWDALCGGILPSTSAAQSAYLDAVWQIPHVCTTIGAPGAPSRLAMFDGVSNIELGRGPNYGFVSYDSDGEWGIVSDSTSGPFTPSPSVYMGALPIVPDVFAPGESWTVQGGFEFGPTFASHSAGYLTIWSAGGAHSVQLLFGPASCQVHAEIRLDDGSLLELDSVPVAYTVGERHTWSVRWIDGGMVALFLNNAKVDEDTPSTGIYDGPVGISLRGMLPDGMRLRKHYGWARALADYEVGVGLDFNTSQTFTYTGAVQKFRVPSGVTAIKITAEGSKGGGSGGGNGERIIALHPCTPLQMLDLYVGGVPWPDGGPGGFAGAFAGSAGGGSSSVRPEGLAFINSWLVAAAGGGFGESSGSNPNPFGGRGGHDNGGNSNLDIAHGATPGAGGTGGPGGDGAFGVGGTPASSGNSFDFGSGGGAGGWWGGEGGRSAGAPNQTGGGGGNGHVDGLCFDIQTFDGVVTGTGSIKIEWEATDLLVNTVLGFSPTSMWYYGGAPATVEDLGSLNNDQTFGTPPGGFVLGPDGGSYPLLGSANNLVASTLAEAYAGSFTTGMTFLVAWRTPAATTLFAGTIMVKQRPGDTATDVNIDCAAVDRFRGSTTRATAGLGADSVVQIAPVPADTWIITECYFPPGDTAPVLYREGIAVAIGDRDTFNNGVRGDNGAGHIRVGGNSVGGFSDARGNYAIAGVWMRQLTAPERAQYRAAAIAEGWV